MTFSHKNFSKNNTPKMAEKIGNALLLISALGATVALLPVSSPVIATIAAYAAFAGAVGKVLTKMAGIETEGTK